MAIGCVNEEDDAYAHLDGEGEQEEEEEEEDSEEKEDKVDVEDDDWMKEEKVGAGGKSKVFI